MSLTDTRQLMINELDSLRLKVSELFLPVRYFKNLNILPGSLFDEEIINKNFDKKWLHKKYFETYAGRSLITEFNWIYADYTTQYRAKLKEVIKQNNLRINANYYVIDVKDFKDNFDTYVDEISFDLSYYYKRYFDTELLKAIENLKTNIDRITNLLTIQDLDGLIKRGHKVVYQSIHRSNHCRPDRLLIKVCPKTIKYQFNMYHDDDDDYNYYIDKKEEFIQNMPQQVFAIKTDEGTYITINKTNIDEYL